MNVALLNERIVIQKNTVVTDAIGNHKKIWADYYTCACTVGGESGSEKTAAAQVVDHSEISFTVRSCALSDAVTMDGFRIRFHEMSYNIVSIDHMNYRHKCIKFRCKREER